MTEDQRRELIRLLEQGEDLSPEWARILFPPEKREYELVYHGKEREEDILADTLAVPLQPVRTFGKNGEDWHNMLIFGDNLQVMKSLLEMKKAGHLCNADGTPGVRLVYIDPPFATKQEFQGNQHQKAYQDKIAGANFLEFLRRRLVLLEKLLADNGSIVIHLDTRKSHYIKVLMDEVFGEQNFKVEIIWYYRKYQMRGMRGFANNSERLLWYTKSASADYVYNPQITPLDTPKYLKRKRWDKELKRIVNVRDEDGNLIYDEYNDEKVDDVWDIPFMGATSPERTGYPTQKPEALLQRVLSALSNSGDLVLDAFVGSGTTCAVAEKLGRRWIGIDCGKLAIYTIQKRMLNLRKEIGNKGPLLKPKPFTLYNAGLYDFSKLRDLPWESWRFFALQLFQCRDEPHKIGGIQLDGYLKGASVLVFNHQKQPGVRIDEETIQSLHEALGSRVGSRLYIIAPALTFDFQQDYIDIEGVRYYALRIPYSIIHELHQREFTALKQPSDEMAVNDTVEAVGFDFIRRPELEYECGVGKRKGGALEEAFIRIKIFKSEAAVREPLRKKGNLETLSMVMLDYDYDDEVFDLDVVFFADAIEKAGWEVRFPLEPLGKQVMAVFIDIYGNEAREVIPSERFRKGAGSGGDRPQAPLGNEGEVTGYGCKR
ncbi:site-specific DNA-methyltransferase [Desulfallas sp. Bu1-1]|uniref:site-specific DNA-methyltransferase n=1 Tax=Desulfallas sp. Bu1-1 TaxID=2787620 RepID=UPI001A9B87D3|nr:site-specific DNA-methyltransferase [Desulfallas sp. Bu1-1]